MKKRYCLICIAVLLAIVLQVSCAGTPSGGSAEESSAPVSAAVSESVSDPASVPETGEVSEEESESPAVINTRAMTSGEIRDRIEGSWAAQMIGVAWGASTEFQYQGKVIPENAVPKWNGDMINDAFGQDDLYVEIPFLDAMYKNGADCSLTTLAEAFRDTAFPLDHANYQGRVNLRAGIPAPLSGNYQFNYHCDDIDWQIEADFLGNLYPGQPEKAAERAFEIGHIMNYGDGVYGGVYIAVMHSAAYTAGSVYEIAEAGRKAIPEGTKFRAVLDEVDKCYKDGMTWQKCWQVIQNEWGSDGRCVRWLGLDANIDAKLNAAYVHIGLLWGDGDLAETIKISMRCGQDSDCNPSSAAGVLGAFYGMSALPGEYVSSLVRSGAVFSNTDYDFEKCITVSCSLAESILASCGVAKEDGAWMIPVYENTDPGEGGLVPFEQWPSDIPCAYLTVSVGTRGEVKLESAYALPEGYTGEVISTYDMGDGTVVPFAVTSYRYLADGTYDISYTVKAGDKESTATVTVTVLGAGSADRGFIVTPSCSVASPQGGGSRDITVISDGFIADYANRTSDSQYDTFTGGFSANDWFALGFDHSVRVTGVLFTDGLHFDNGGWYETTPSVQVLKDGVWTDVSSTCDPAYGGNEPFTTFTFTLDSPVWCEGVRVTGKPGGSATFVSCAELDVLFDEVKDPTYIVENPDPVKDAFIIFTVTEPRGTGCKNPEIIRDGYIPKASDSYTAVSYDTFAYDASDHEEYVGYVFRGNYTVTAVTFTEGAHFHDGGYFKGGAIRVEILVDGEWRTVEATPDKPYPVGSVQGAFGANYESYRFVLVSPAECGGVRIIGDAGGSMHFISVSELSVEFGD